MARYFFDVAFQAQTIPDEFGIICSDNDTAMDQAWRGLDFLVGKAEKRLAFQHTRISVRREDGLKVGTIKLSIALEREDTVIAHVAAQIANDPKKIAP